MRNFKPCVVKCMLKEFVLPLLLAAAFMYLVYALAMIFG